VVGVCAERCSLREPWDDIKVLPYRQAFSPFFATLLCLDLCDVVVEVSFPVEDWEKIAGHSPPLAVAVRKVQRRCGIPELFCPDFPPNQLPFDLPLIGAFD
jgi:hypothetical protein